MKVYRWFRFNDTDSFDVIHWVVVFDLVYDIRLLITKGGEMRLDDGGFAFVGRSEHMFWQQVYP